MNGNTLQFNLETDIADTEFYVGSGDSQYIRGKDIPTFFTQSETATGSLTPTSGTLSTCSISIHIWADEDHTDKVVFITLQADTASSSWSYSLHHLDKHYQVERIQQDTNDFTFIVQTADTRRPRAVDGVSD